MRLIQLLAGAVFAAGLASNAIANTGTVIGTESASGGFVGNFLESVSPGAQYIVASDDEVYFDPFGGWQWQPCNPVYDQMIVLIYVALGVCALRAIRDPLQHASFLWFVVASSMTHGGIMLFHAATHRMYIGHLVGDVWILAGGLSLAVPLWRLSRASDAPAGSASGA